MDSTLRREILTESYEDMKGLIAHTTWRHYRRYGGDFDDLLSEANLAFIRASDSFDDDKAPFSVWLTFTIETHLLDHIRKNFRQNQITTMSITNEDGGIWDDLEPYHNIVPELNLSFLEELTNDLKIIMQIAFDPIQPKTKKGKWTNCELHKQLKQKGWKHSRIWRAFKDLRTITSK